MNPLFLSLIPYSHLNYGDVIYDQPLNESLSNRTESVQFKAALAITGPIQG